MRQTMTQFIPRDYQTKIINKQKEVSSFIIAKMGCGKTAATLQTISKLLAENPKAKILITAPLAVAKSVWHNEINKWLNFKDLDYSLCLGSEINRIKALNVKATITIINHDNIYWLNTILKSKITGRYNMLVVDESSCFKNPSSKRFKALRNMSRHVKVVTLLTGTPAPNSYLELWSQVFLLDGGKRLGSTFGKYKSKYFTVDYLGYSYTIKEGAMEEIRNKIRDMCVVVESYASIPSRVDTVIDVQMNAKALVLYKQMKKDYLIKIKESNEEITAVNSAVLVNKLAQLANGAIYNEDKQHVIIHDDKLEMLSELINQVEGNNIIVAYNYKHDLIRIKERFKQAVSIKDENAVSRWNNGEIKILLAHPKSAGHGLNLQKGGNVIIWFSPTWSSELNQQFNARLVRQGQESTVLIYTLASVGTIDHDIINSVRNKTSVQSLLTNYLKNLL